MPPAGKHPKRRSASRGRWIAAAVVLAIFAGLAALVAWAVVTARSPAPRPPIAADSFDRFEPDWTSAMEKAGVEATFPPSPLDVESLLTTGSRPFEATFTAAEITALMNVYVFDAGTSAETIDLSGVDVEFPAVGIGALSGRLTSGGSNYDARIEGPISYAATGIRSPGATSLEVEGFNVKGARRTQASQAVIAYLNTYVRAAPGLVLEDARIVEGGITVKGSAPQRIENP